MHTCNTSAFCVLTQVLARGVYRKCACARARAEVCAGGKRSVDAGRIAGGIWIERGDKELTQLEFAAVLTSRKQTMLSCGAHRTDWLGQTSVEPVSQRQSSPPAKAKA